MSKINIEDRTSKEKVEIPVEIIEDVDYSEPLNNSEEKYNIQKHINIIFYVVWIILIIVCMMFLLWKPTIEELRIEQKTKATELLKNNTDLYNRYINKAQTLSWEIQNIKVCIDRNSTKDLVFNCNLWK